MSASDPFKHLLTRQVEWKHLRQAFVPLHEVLKETGMIDLTSEFGARVARRLEKEPIIWMTTVGPDGTPQPSPVWFLWADQTLLIYSRPNTPKLRNIQHNPRVALNFDGDGHGGDIIVFNGEAAIDPHAPPSNELPAYQEKYREHIAEIGMTPETFAQAYSVAVRVKPTKIRGH